MNQVERFWQIETDLEPLGLCRWSLEPGKSVPAGAVVFASLGVDGIQFCVLPDPGDEKLERAPVYAVSPQNPEHVLEPLAEDLLHFFSLVVQAGDAGILESASYYSRLEFEDALSSPGLGADFEQEQKLASAALESAFPLFKIPDPFGYLERMRLRFPRNVIQFDRKTDEFPQETEQ